MTDSTNIENIISRSISNAFAEYSKNLCNTLDSVLQYRYGLIPQNLENCTGDAQSTLIGDEESVYRRERAYVGDAADGKPVYRWVEGNNQRDLQKSIAFKQFESGIMWEWIEEWAKLKGVPVNLFGKMQIPNSQCDNQSKNNKTSTPFDSFAQMWLERYIHGNKSETYFNTIKSRVSNMCKFFSCIPIEEITADLVQDYLNSNSKCSKNTVNLLLIC